MSFSPVLLKTVHLHDVVVLPERHGCSGAWHDGKPVPLAHLFRNGRQARRQTPPVEAVRTVEAPCIFGGFLHSHYGHFLIESLCNLYAFGEYPDRRIVWRNVTAETVQPWAAHILSMLGCDRNGYEYVNEPVLFKDIIFPLPGLMADMWLTPAQAEAFAVYDSPAPTGRRVWLSRSHVNSDNLVFTNEIELEAMLSSRGWLIFHPEEHSIEEQLEVFASSAVVMGCIGSAFHSLLLLKNPRARYIVINRMNGDSEAHNAQFDLIAKARTDNYYVWDVPRHDAPPLRRRRTHHAWPWYAFDLDVIAKALEESDDFSGDLSGCPGMVPISERQRPNDIRPVMCQLDSGLADTLYYHYRHIKLAARPVKNWWVGVQQKLWKRWR